MCYLAVLSEVLRKRLPKRFVIQRMTGRIRIFDISVRQHQSNIIHQFTETKVQKKIGLLSIPFVCCLRKIK